MKARIVPATEENIRQAAQLLREGRVVGMPTETVYGLAGNALDASALALIFSTKERPTFDPLIVHVAGLAEDDRLGQLEALQIVDASRLGDAARERGNALLRRFWPGPFSLVLPKGPAVPDLATSGLPTVAVRMPEHPVAQALIAEAGTPLAAPSANRFGRISPTSPQDVAEELGDRIELILDGGRSTVGVESTVVLLDANGTLVLLRPGGTPSADIEQAAGTALQTLTAPERLASPGMLESHYAPRRPLRLLPSPLGELTAESLETSGLRAELAQLPPDAPLGLLLLSGDADAGAKQLEALTGHPTIGLTLSPEGKLNEAARNLFASLRALDQSEAALILSEPCREQTGLGHAIADRLRRASAH